tara:strand:- start:39 stop:899 length:861 start_codon:yes stop_codon:yes gene_type:complete
MKKIKYLFEFVFIILLLLIFKIIGYKYASNLGEKIGKLIGPLTRSKKKIIKNLEQSRIGKDNFSREIIIKNMWGNYGRILAEYPHLKNFKNNKLNKFLDIQGKNVLEKLKHDKKKAIFISAHFNNFELMAMQIENLGFELCAIYRPLNNFFLNPIMEYIRNNHICKNQIKKGKSGTRELLKLFKEGKSIALMIDQRVSEGAYVNFFSRKCYTTTIPAQLIKKYDCEIIPVYIERKNKYYFNLCFKEPVRFEKNLSIESITLELNKIIEKMIEKKPDQWIWSHDRWK